MRLINTATLALEDKFTNIPKYAILSHTWGDGEVSFTDWQGDLEAARKKEGFRKIELTCQQAAHDGYQYAWVDTNCIDKTSSSELSEAINSMFAWYRDAQVCYVFLKDVVVKAPDGTALPTATPGTAPINKKHLADPAVRKAFKASAWFTRGWTLQELLAPSKVIFFSYEWLPLATKEAERRLISDITDIDSDYIKRPEHINTASVARRMSWMAKRRTTRIEDTAYCLLGLFGIHMALLYGEGHRAFLRLQEEIIRVSNDQTIFCWQANKMGRLPPSSLYGSEDMTPGTSGDKTTTEPQHDTHRQAELEQWTSILAPHPKVFRDSALYFSEFGNTAGSGGGGGSSGMNGSTGSLGGHGHNTSASGTAATSSDVGPYSITNFGLSISLPLLYTAKGACAVLDVGYRRTSSDPASRIVIPLHRVQSGHYIRLSTQLLVMMIPAALTAARTEIFVDCRNAQSRGAALLLGQRISARPVNMAGDVVDKHHPVLFLTFNKPVDLDRTPLVATDMDFVPFHSAIEVSNHRLGTQSAVILTGKAAAGGSGSGAWASTMAATESFHLLVGGRSNRVSSSAVTATATATPTSAAAKQQRGILPHSASSGSNVSGSSPLSPSPATPATPTSSAATTVFGAGADSNSPDDQQLSMDWHADVWARPPPPTAVASDAAPFWNEDALKPLIDRLSATYFGSWCTSPALRNVLSWRYSPEGALVCYFELDELYSGNQEDEAAAGALPSSAAGGGGDDDDLRFSHLRRSDADTSSMQQLYTMLQSTHQAKMMMRRTMSPTMPQRPGQKYA